METSCYKKGYKNLERYWCSKYIETYFSTTHITYHLQLFNTTSSHIWAIPVLPVSLEPTTFQLLESTSRLLRSVQLYFLLSKPRTSDRLISHWKALCLLAYDNWRCRKQPEIFTHQSA